MRHKKIIPLSLALVLGSASMLHAKDLTALAKELAGLRQEVAELENQIADKRASYRAQEDSLSRQVAEMEGDVRREELVLEKIRMEISSRQTRLKDIGGEETPIKKAVLQSCAQLEAHIQQALPFKQNARSKVLRSSKNKLKPICSAPAKQRPKFGASSKTKSDSRAKTRWTNKSSKWTDRRFRPR